ncbi:MAG: ABC transporter permease subunit [Rhizobiales bacterium]|nr:ABC transporter permease subunit [Hyphomicrobiales bacterium]
MRERPNTIFAFLGGPQFRRWVFLSALMIFLVLPLLPLAIWSGAFNWFFPSLLPSVWSTRAWAYVFSPTAAILPALWNSAVIAGGTVAISLLIGIPAGRAIGLYDFRGKRLVEFLVLAPTIVPPLAVVLGIHVVFIRLGLADTMAGVILVHLIPVTPYVTMILAGVFANYDPEYEEQARTLGAGPLTTIWRVMLPSIFPGVVVAGLFAFLISWSQYVVTLLIGGGQVQTLPLLLYAFVRSGDFAISGAIAIVFIGPGVLMLILTARYLTGRNQSIGGLGGA